MTKTITIERMKTTKKRVRQQATLPDYSKQDMLADDYDSVNYTRVGEDRRGVTVGITSYPAYCYAPTRYEIEMERNAVPFFDDDDHIAGVSRSSREEFLAAAREVRDLLDSIITEAEGETKEG